MGQWTLLEIQTPSNDKGSISKQQSEDRTLQYTTRVELAVQVKKIFDPYLIPFTKIHSTWNKSFKIIPKYKSLRENIHQNMLITLG